MTPGTTLVAHYKALRLLDLSIMVSGSRLVLWSQGWETLPSTLSAVLPILTAIA